jgi:hypothetical protein
LFVERPGERHEPQNVPTYSDERFTDIRLFGYELLHDPLLNKGTAFSKLERDAFELHGFLPPNAATPRQGLSGLWIE